MRVQPVCLPSLKRAVLAMAILGPMPELETLPEAATPLLATQARRRKVRPAGSRPPAQAVLALVRVRARMPVRALVVVLLQAAAAKARGSAAGPEARAAQAALGWPVPAVVPR